jgi:hypothetical protein
LISSLPDARFGCNSSRRRSSFSWGQFDESVSAGIYKPKFTQGISMQLFGGIMFESFVHSFQIHKFRGRFKKQNNGSKLAAKYQYPILTA